MRQSAADALARSLMREHGLSDWTLAWMRRKSTFGLCNCSRKTIALSTPLVTCNEEAAVRDTILHEIAHALTPGSGHNHLWKAKCREIGARPVKCFTSNDATLVEYAWRCWCPTCDALLPGGFHRKPTRARRCRKHNATVTFVKIQYGQVVARFTPVSA